MKQISIADLIPGMVAAEDILSHDDQIVVPKGVVFTENIIARLESYYIYYVNIEEDKADDLSHPIMPQMTDAGMTITDLCGFDNPVGKKTKDNEQFRHFLSAFKRCSEHYHFILTGAIYRNEPFLSDDLLREVMSLFQQCSNNVNIFDMLLNIHNIKGSLYDHCINVALIANILSRWLGFSESDQLLATTCGLFHDAGKLLLPVGVLKQPRKLTSDEANIIKTHTIEGFHLLSRYESIPDPVRNTALMHHERCDGSGYPYSLKGDEISRFAKLVAIADSFEAMVSEQAHRSPICPLSIVKYFEDSGIQKYELKYILTFLENVLNLYLNYKITLSHGMEGNVIFINRGNPSKPVICSNSSETADLQKEYYNSILLLSNIENLSIETII